jgi:acyl-CoA reductase-like NAD-dependent aldehyde dehydrogenase
MASLTTVSPVDGRVYCTRPLAQGPEIEAVLAKAHAAKAGWRATPLAERIAALGRMVDAVLSARDAIAEELTWQMGRPLGQTPGELRGFEERARHMLAIAPEALADVAPTAKPGFARFVRRDPLGLVFVVAPWNYPFLTSVNAVVPALAAGNTVLLKHSHQTPLVAERYHAAAEAAGLPAGVFQILHVGHEDTARIVGDARVDFVCFTGSVDGGRAIQRAVGERFIAAGLELGGKDPAYVRADADLAHAVENLVDGAFFNSGQSCCGIERIYVHESLYAKFVDGYVDLAKQYKLGNPLDKDTNLGPMVRTAAADFVRAQTAEAVRQGARALVDPKLFPADAPGTPYLAPQVLVEVDHRMRVMTEESFGPVVGIMRVAGDDEAVELMNDSAYGLTAALWTADEKAAREIGGRIETGTVFMNRCDYLDPGLAWTGVKNTGRGATLSALGYEQLTRPKSFHLRTTL